MNKQPSGELVFGRFANVYLRARRALQEIPFINPEQKEYEDLVLMGITDNPDSAVLVRFRHLSRNLLPWITIAFAEFAGIFRSDYFNTAWLVEVVRKYWYFVHSDYRTIFARVRCPFHIQGAYMCESGLDAEIIAVDPYGILEQGSAPGVEVVIYRGVICDIRDPNVKPATAPSTVQADYSRVVVHRAQVGDILDSFRGENPVWSDPL